MTAHPQRSAPPFLSHPPSVVVACVAGGVRGAAQGPRKRAPQRLAREVRDEDGHGRSRAHWRQYPGRRRAQVTRNIPRKVFSGTDGN